MAIWHSFVKKTESAFYWASTPKEKGDYHFSTDQLTTHAIKKQKQKALKLKQEQKALKLKQEQKALKLKQEQSEAEVRKEVLSSIRLLQDAGLIDEAGFDVYTQEQELALEVAPSAKKVLFNGEVETVETVETLQVPSENPVLNSLVELESVNTTKATIKEQPKRSFKGFSSWSEFSELPRNFNSTQKVKQGLMVKTKPFRSQFSVDVGSQNKTTFSTLQPSFNEGYSNREFIKNGNYSQIVLITLFILSKQKFIRICFTKLALVKKTLNFKSFFSTLQFSSPLVQVSKFRCSFDNK